MNGRPGWLKTRYSYSPTVSTVRSILSKYRLNTVCDRAACPNVFECFASGTATFLVLGDICTRNCRFCRVSAGVPRSVDPGEPLKAARAVEELALEYAVITSVTRDDLPDGGAAHFAAVIGAVRETIPACEVEVLVPDFGGDLSALKTVLEAGPAVLAHNIETVPRLYPGVRPRASYERSLNLIGAAKRLAPTIPAKSGIMLGLGESPDEALDVFQDLRDHGCDILTVGQYLAPSPDLLPVERYYALEEFDELREAAVVMGFARVLAGPLVRSSYRASNPSAEARSR
ncbi:MAG: lipoyl synthase [Candidatus Aquicultorales bacterium]